MRHLFLALTNAAEGRDDDFNEWYDRHHVREVVRHAPGFVSGRRYALYPLQRTGALSGDPSPWRYLAIYEIESDDLPATHAALARHSQEVGFTSPGDALDPCHLAWVYPPIGRAVTGGTSLGDEEHVFLAFTNAAEGREDDLNAWYDEHHVQEIVERMPGFTSGRRYVARPENQRPGQSPPWKYLALYELAGDMERIHEGDAEIRASGTLTQADGAFDRESLGIWVYTPLGPRLAKAGLEATVA